MKLLLMLGLSGCVGTHADDLEADETPAPGPPTANRAAAPDDLTGTAAITRTWQAPTMLAADVYRLEIADDDTGRVTAFWSTKYVPEEGLWTSTYAPGQGWETPQMLQATDEVGNIDLEAGAPGVMALWTAWIGGAQQVFSSIRAPGHDWSPAFRLDDGDAGLFGAALARNAHGEAIAAWIIGNYPDYDLRVRRFDPYTGWGPTSTVTAGPSHALRLDVALDDDGVATLVWWDYGETLLASRAGAAGPWSAPATLSGSAEPQLPWLTVDHDNQVTAIWNTPYGPLHAARFAAGGWSAPVQISDSAGGFRPRFEGDAQGRIMATWTQSETASAAGWGTYFDGDTWATATPFETGAFEYPVADTGLDATGEALVVWTQGDTALNAVVRARHYTPHLGWNTTVTDLAYQQGLAAEARVAVAASGRATALWTLMDITGGRRTLWTAAYE